MRKWREVLEDVEGRFRKIEGKKDAKRITGIMGGIKMKRRKGLMYFMVRDIVKALVMAG